MARLNEGGEGEEAIILRLLENRDGNGLHFLAFFLNLLWAKVALLWCVSQVVALIPLYTWLLAYYSL